MEISKLALPIHWGLKAGEIANKEFLQKNNTWTSLVGT